MSDLPNTDADILKAFPQPTCLKILEFLSDGERCVCEISPGIGEGSPTPPGPSTCCFFSTQGGAQDPYAIKHPEVPQVLSLAEQIMTNEISGRHKLLKAV